MNKEKSREEQEKQMITSMSHYLTFSTEPDYSGEAEKKMNFIFPPSSDTHQSSMNALDNLSSNSLLKECLWEKPEFFQANINEQLFSRNCL